MTIAIVCGSRNWKDLNPIRESLSKLPEGSVIIHGAQRGADLAADSVAKELGFETIPIEADWDTYGNAAGPVRNQEMLNMLIKSCIGFNQPGHCYAFHEDMKLGKGTRDMVIRSIKSKIRTFVWIQVKETIRASHLCVCRVCKREYIYHPAIISELDSEGNSFLNHICDLGPVKL